MYEYEYISGAISSLSALRLFLCDVFDFVLFLRDSSSDSTCTLHFSQMLFITDSWLFCKSSTLEVSSDLQIGMDTKSKSRALVQSVMLCLKLRKYEGSQKLTPIVSPYYCYSRNIKRYRLRTLTIYMTLFESHKANIVIIVYS